MLPSITARISSGSAAGRASATEAALETCRTASPAARRTAAASTSRDSPSPTRISSGDLMVPAVGTLATSSTAPGEPDRRQQRDELAPVGSDHALTARSGLQALRGPHDPDHHDVCPGLVGGTLAQRVAGHLRRLLRLQPDLSGSNNSRAGQGPSLR